MTYIIQKFYTIAKIYNDMSYPTHDCDIFVGNLPPPTTPDEVGARVLAQERFEEEVAVRTKLHKLMSFL